MAEINDKVEEIEELSPENPKPVIVQCFSHILEEAGVPVDDSLDTSVAKYLSSTPDRIL